MNLTKHQYDAIHIHNQNLVVTAGAGSGKTRVLVERYLALLDKHSTWDLNSLVAITFTSKAAQEMRDRVRIELEKRYRKEQGEGALRWSNLLAQMESARIDTIHALCASILRANAAEAAIDPAFKVLDEIEAAVMLDDAIDAALQQLVNEGNPAVTLFSIYDNKAIRDALNQELVGTHISDLPDDLFAQWQAEWEANAQRLLGEYVVAVTSALAASGGYAPRGEDVLSKGWLVVQLEMLSLTPVTTAPIGLSEGLRALREIAAISMPSSIAKLWGTDGIDAKEQLRFIRDTAKKILAALGEPPNGFDREAARLLPYWLELVRRVQINFREAKARESVLDFNDLENRARELLTHNVHVRERYRGKEFKHILVDEFQDTNEAQWDIVRALADPIQSGSLFIVGDEKQSIYAFRGADVRVFGKARVAIEDGGGKNIPLAKSFRTHKPLVDGFNSVFKQLLISEQGRHYEVRFGDGMDAARDTPPHTAPALELLLIDKSLLEKESDKTEAARRWEAYEIAQRLHEMVRGGMLIFDKERSTIRTVQYGDMALLFQSMSHVTVYEEVFKASGLPFVTVAGRGYYDRQEVWDVINLLTVLHNPADNLALAAVLRSPMFSLSDDALFALRLVQDESKKVVPLWDALNAPAYLPADEVHVAAFARETLYALKHIAGRVTISELLRDALARTGYLATLSGLPDGARKRANVEKLLDKAQSTGQVTLGAFQQYLRDLSAREVREGEASLEAAGTVTLMTVHASKGLEFPVVVLPDSSWANKGYGGDMLMFDEGVLACKVFDEFENKFVPSYPYRRLQAEAALREQAERKRLLYVAATRAQDMLIISGQYSVTKAGEIGNKGLWLGWLLDALKITGWEQGESVFQREWGTLRLYNPTTLPPSEAYVLGVNDTESAWDSLAVRSRQFVDGTQIQPPLLSRVAILRDRRARNLSATQLADLGAAEFEPYYRQKLRRGIQPNVPTSVDQVSERSPRVSGRILGDIVHEALRWWRFPTPENDLQELLQNYAWEQGIIDDIDLAYAVKTARQWLVEIRRSELYEKVQHAVQVFRELPFIFQTEKRTIHGVIDMLLQEANGTWTIVDYKTSYVEDGFGVYKPYLLKEHARRYHLQMGVYAEAVRAQLNHQHTPHAYIHYLRYRRTVEVSEAEWRSALTKLEDHIGKFMWEENDVE
jgi:ATP-dependent helicase/nuclease subunit A